MPGSTNGRRAVRIEAGSASVAAALSLALLLLPACGAEKRVDSTPSSGSRSVSPSSGESGDEQPAWAEEMAREVPFPPATISQAELSGRIAFASTRSGPHTVFTLNAGTSEDPVRLIYGMEPVWSPDGSQIAFVSSYTDGGDEITVMNADGSNARRLTNDEGQDRGPSWSPDGTQIAYWSERDGSNEKREIYVIGVDGGSPRRMTKNGHSDMWPAWSRDGKEIVYESYRGDGAELFAVSVEDGQERRVSPVGLDAREPAWSPDGSELAILSSTDAGWAIVVMSPDGSEIRKVVEGKSIRNPQWSPDASYLIFACTPEDAANEEICVVDAAGTRFGNLTNDGGGYDWEPSWTQ